MWRCPSAATCVAASPAFSSVIWCMIVRRVPTSPWEAFPRADLARAREETKALVVDPPLVALEGLLEDEPPLWRTAQKSPPRPRQAMTKARDESPSALALEPSPGFLGRLPCPRLPRFLDEDWDSFCGCPSKEVESPEPGTSRREGRRLDEARLLACCSPACWTDWEWSAQYLKTWRMSARDWKPFMGPVAVCALAVMTASVEAVLAAWSTLWDVLAMSSAPFLSDSESFDELEDRAAAAAAAAAASAELSPAEGRSRTSQPNTVTSCKSDRYMRASCRSCEVMTVV
mmetsp:Transcript_20066/g.58679  ORF Transcript_20066/g.58679 Transcript_20066/m.58679 type:complete len:287 (+) Transcript_20066:257-1117(+)